MSGGSKSKTASTTAYSNEDRRVVADNGALGFSAGNVLGAGAVGVEGSKNKLGFSDSSTNWSSYADNSDRSTWSSYADNSDRSTSTVTNITALDGGAIKSSEEIVKSALATVEHGDATNGDGFTRLLDLAGNLFEGAGYALERAQSQAADVAAGALATSAELKTAGSIDNKTIMVIAVAGALAWGLSRK